MNWNGNFTVTVVPWPKALTSSTFWSSPYNCFNLDRLLLTPIPTLPLGVNPTPSSATVNIKWPPSWRAETVT